MERRPAVGPGATKGEDPCAIAPREQVKFSKPGAFAESAHFPAALNQAVWQWTPDPWTGGGVRAGPQDMGTRAARSSPAWALAARRPPLTDFRTEGYGLNLGARTKFGFENSSLTKLLQQRAGQSSRPRWRSSKDRLAHTACAAGLLAQQNTGRSLALEFSLLCRTSCPFREGPVNFPNSASTFSPSSHTLRSSVACG